MIEFLKAILFTAFKKTKLKDEHCWVISSIILAVLYVIMFPRLFKQFSLVNGFFLLILDLIFSEQLKRENFKNKNFLRFSFLLVMTSFVLGSYVLRCASLGFLILNSSSPYNSESKTQKISYLALIGTVIFYRYSFSDSFDKMWVELMFTLALLLTLMRNCFKGEQSFQSLILSTLMFEAYLSLNITHYPALFLLPLLAVASKMLLKLEYENMTRNMNLLISRKQLVWLALCLSLYFLSVDIFIFALAVCIVSKELTSTIVKIYSGIILGQYILITSFFRIESLTFYSFLLISILAFILYLLVTQKIEKIRSYNVSIGEVQAPVLIMFLFSYFFLYLTLPTSFSGLGISSLVFTISLITGTSLIFIIKSTQGHGRRYIPFIMELPQLKFSLGISAIPSLFFRIKQVPMVTIGFLYNLLEEVESRTNGLHLFIFCSLLMFAFWATRMGM